MAKAVHMRSDRAEVPILIGILKYTLCSKTRWAKVSVEVLIINGTQNPATNTRETPHSAGKGCRAKLSPVPTAQPPDRGIHLHQGVKGKTPGQRFKS